MSRKMGSITVLGILIIYSLVVAILLFGLMTSTGVVRNKNFEFGGAAAGFVFTFAFLTWRYVKMEDTAHNRALEISKIKNIELALTFDPESPNKPPRIDEMAKAECFYTILNNDEIVVPEKKVPIKTDDITRIPYINIQIDPYENPLYNLRFVYNNIEWKSDTYSQKKRGVILR